MYVIRERRSEQIRLKSPHTKKGSIYYNIVFKPIFFIKLQVKIFRIGFRIAIQSSDMPRVIPFTP